MHIDDDGQGQFDQDDDVLELTDEVEDDAPDPDDGDDEQGGDDHVIGFAEDGEDEEDDTPLVKRLRDQVRTLQRSRRAPQQPAANDPEPVVPERPRSLADFDYDEDRFNAAIDAYEGKKDEHASWQRREETRKADRERAAEDQGRQLEQQRKALGVDESVYKARAAKVYDALSEQQVAVLVEAADNPSRLIFALGGSDTRLDMLAGQEKLAKFAAMVGTMEKEVKMGKKSPPPPESRVRGATAPVAAGSSDKKLAALQAKAEKTGDRSELIAYKASLKSRAA